MEKIIATELSPSGIDDAFLSYLDEHSSSLALENAVLYYGFPVFKDYDEETVQTNFCILSEHHGLILFNVSHHADLSNMDEATSQLYSQIESALKKSRLLRRGKRDLSIPFESFIYCSGSDFDGDLDNQLITSTQALENILSELSCEVIDEQYINEVRSILEGSKALVRSVKRNKISNDPKTKLNVLIELEKEITNFDAEQKRIAISLINGPQRIRGLAGSGKTVVLAMKAAHIHLQYPDKKILLTFYTKSLYGLIKDSFERFYRHFANYGPDWEKIDILHSWGGANVDGVSYSAAKDNGLSPLTFSEAKSRNSFDPFSIVCGDLLRSHIKSKYDYILIDEAQDLPNEFFRLCYQLAHGDSGREKNIVWAYDDLQSIFNVYQRTPEELFGQDSDGRPLVDLNFFGQALSSGQKNDLVLYKCYRNPLEVLITAHALGFGIYSDQMVQALENEAHWQDVGYELHEGQAYEVGKEVVVERPASNSPLSISKFQSKSDVVKYFTAKSIQKECDWVVSEVESAVSEGIDPHEIMVICLDDRNAKSYFSNLSAKLLQRQIRSNNLLTSFSANPPFKLDGLVTLTTVHRAKGNEAAVVICMGIDALFHDRKRRKGRNKLFTAFTRTKAWLRVSGIGNAANYFFEEIDKAVSNSPNLCFVVPDKDDIETIQRDLNANPKELENFQKAIEELKSQGYSESEIETQLELTLGIGDKGESK